MDNTEIEARFSTGGENDLESVINLFGEKLLRYAMVILCNHQDAEDVVQEVFLAAYKNRHTFDGKNLSAWLYKITYNRSINQLKKRRLLWFNEMRNEVISPEEDAGLSDETLRALRRLKPKERALIYGRIMEEQTYEELSALSGSSPAALRKQYERAKNKLAGYLTVRTDSPHRKEPKYEQI